MRRGMCRDCTGCLVCQERPEEDWDMVEPDDEQYIEDFFMDKEEE